MSDEFEDTERSRILSIIRSELSFPQIGEVQAVHPHTGDEDIPANHDVDVGIPPGPNPRNTLRRKPFLVPTSGVASPPEEDDLVLVQYLRGEGDDAIVTHVAYGDDDSDRAPKAETEGVYRLVRDNLYVEVEAEGVWARIAKKSDDLADPDLVVQVDQDGVKIGNPDGDLQPVARQGDEVQVSTSSGIGSITEGSSDVESS